MDAKSINELLQNHGKNLRGESLWRLVWSDAQTEVRIGTYNEYYGAVFLRTVKGAVEVPKYPFLRERWVLELWQPPALAYTPELPNSVNGSYEPVFVFEDNQHNALPLRWDVCEICINHYNQPKKSKMLRESEDRAKEETARQKQRQQDEDALEVSPITNALHMKEAVFISHKRKEHDVQ